MTKQEKEYLLFEVLDDDNKKYLASFNTKKKAIETMNKLTHQEPGIMLYYQEVNRYRKIHNLNEENEKRYTDIKNFFIAMIAGINETNNKLGLLCEMIKNEI